MFLEPQDARYLKLIDILQERHLGKTDLNGRPWSEHYRRVALRVAMLNPLVSRDQLEAALFHDALFNKGGGSEFMQEIEMSPEAIRIVTASTPPADQDFFRELHGMTPQLESLYQEYIGQMIETGDIPTIEFKLADVFDTLEQLTYSINVQIRTQIANQYVPARDKLEAALRKLT